MTQPAACQLVLNDALQMTLPAQSIPTTPLPEGLDPIEANPRHISLVSRRGMFKVAHLFETLDLASFTPPTPIIGEPRLVVRAGKEGKADMVCMVSRIENHEEIKRFVNTVFAAAGVPNPENRFVYHLTLANNAGGHPWGSIAYLNPSDFQGEPQPVDQVFAQREIDPAWPNLGQRRTPSPRR